MTYTAKHSSAPKAGPKPAQRHTSARSLEVCAETVQAGLSAQDEAWGKGGWTRRRFIAGAGMVGAATLASQLVTTRASFSTAEAATPKDAGTAPTLNTLIVIFMRGAADGLRILVPNSSDLGLSYLREVRSPLVPGAANLVALPGQSGWAVNSAIKPLYDTLWATNELGFVPAVSTPGIPRSHFEAQQYLEKGGSVGATTGWLERVLEQLGTGTTFRAVAEGGALPLSLAGAESALALSSISQFKLGTDTETPLRQQALLDLYRGLPGSLGEDVPNTMSALADADRVRATATPQNGATYGTDPFSKSLQDLAAMLRAEVGLQVATVDVGGWDTHTDEVNDLDRNLTSFAQSLSAFMTDLGPDRRKRVTVVVQTEFGRRVATNGNGGTDHGHGSVMWLMGGGLTSSGVFGSWTPLAASALDNGDVPGLNNPFSVLGNIVQQRLGAGSLSTVFPGQTLDSFKVAKAG